MTIILTSELPIESTYVRFNLDEGYIAIHSTKPQIYVDGTGQTYLRSPVFDNDGNPVLELETGGDPDDPECWVEKVIKLPI